MSAWSGPVEHQPTVLEVAEAVMPLTPSETRTAGGAATTDSGFLPAGVDTTPEGAGSRPLTNPETAGARACVGARAPARITLVSFLRYLMVKTRVPKPPSGEVTRVRLVAA